MNFIRIAIYTMLFNLAIGITIALFLCPANSDNNCVSLFNTSDTRGGLQYDSTFTKQFDTGTNGSVQPYASLADQGSIIDQILDKLAIGVLLKFLNSLNFYLYGFASFIDTIFSSMFSANQALRFLVINGLKFIITLSYIMGAVELWSTRRTLISGGGGV